MNELKKDLLTHITEYEFRVQRVAIYHVLYPNPVSLAWLVQLNLTWCATPFTFNVAVCKNVSKERMSSTTKNEIIIKSCTNNT